MTGNLEVKKFLRDRMELLISHPLHHSPSAEALEESLIQLDHVFQLATHSVDFDRDRNSRYFDFIMSKGYGVGTVAGATTSAEEREAEMEAVVSIWKAYVTEFYSESMFGR
jgi:hypothetical protein